METVKIHDKEFKIFISKEKIQKRIQELGATLSKKFKGKKPIFISILNGSFVLVADLVRACDFDCELSFIKLSSYQKMQTTGKVNVIMGLDIDVEGYDVIVVEDIIDTGNTLSKFIPDLYAEKPKSVTILTLLFKPDALKNDIQIDHIGFEIPNKFVVGYGLDYDGLGRTIPDILQLQE